MIYKKLFTEDSQNSGCTAEEVVFVANLSKKGWFAHSYEDRRSRANWMDAIVKFTQRYPNDTFTIKSYRGGKWPECLIRTLKNQNSRYYYPEHWF